MDPTATMIMAPQSIEQVMAHPYAKKIFALYCKKCFVEELFTFLDEAEEIDFKFKQHENEDFGLSVQSLFDRYLSDQTALEINVSASIKKQVKENMKNKQLTSVKQIFHPAISHAQMMLKADVLPRFVRSREWLRFLRTGSGRQFSIFQEHWVPKEVFYSSEDLERAYIIDKDFEMVNYLQEDAPHWEMGYNNAQTRHSVYFSDKMVTDPKLAGKKKILLIKHERYVPCSAEAMIKVLSLSRYYKQAIPGTKSLECLGTSTETIEPASPNSRQTQRVPLFYSKSVHQFAPILPPNEFRYVSTLRYFPNERKYIAFRKTTSAQGEAESQVFSTKAKHSLGVSYTAEVVHQITENTCRCCTIVFGFANFKAFFNMIASKLSKAVSRRNQKVISKILEEAQKDGFESCKQDELYQLSLKVMQQNALLNGEWDQLPETFRLL